MSSRSLRRGLLICDELQHPTGACMCQHTTRQMNVHRHLLWPPQPLSIHTHTHTHTHSLPITPQENRLYPEVLNSPRTITLRRSRQLLGCHTASQTVVGLLKDPSPIHRHQDSDCTDSGAGCKQSVTESDIWFWLMIVIHPTGRDFVRLIHFNELCSRMTLNA